MYSAGKEASGLLDGLLGAAEVRGATQSSKNALEDKRNEKGVELAYSVMCSLYSSDKTRTGRKNCMVGMLPD